MDRIELINGTIHRFGYRHYLEIGVQKGACFEAIRATRKTGVDPDMRYLKRRYPANPLQRLLKRRLPTGLFWQFESNTIRLYELTSDDFFARNNDKFDLVFIDGLHHFDQVLKDYINAQQHLSAAGCVMLHDCNPLSAESAQREPSVQTKVWNGDTWKAIYYLRCLGQQIDVYPFDQGCAVAPKQSVATISWDEEDLRKLYDLPYEVLAADRAGAVGLRPWPGFTEEFTERFRAIEMRIHGERQRYRAGEGDR